ncbi:trypsin-like serine peptidase [Longispora albida]|uniref:trypsin-like serine peptidase n=1 Tax=Longispora albida TaxID=203523 RepID=UPI0012FA0988|nr:serine protease [Longispora albida]
MKVLVSALLLSALLVPAGTAAAGQPQATQDGVVAAAAQQLAGPPVTLHYPGSQYVIAQLLVPPGSSVEVTDATGRQRRTYTASGWTYSVEGDTMLLTSSSARIVRTARGFRPGEKLCGDEDFRNVTCYAKSHPWTYEHSKAVARLRMVRPEGVFVCTAWRIGEGDRMLTNNHCFSTEDQAQGVEVQFNYQCGTCDSTTVDTEQVIKVRPAGILTTRTNPDFTLYRVSDPGTIAHFGYLELATGAADVGEPVYIPQHPAGRPKQLAIHDDQLGGNRCEIGGRSATRLHYTCDTLGGSSGSPVLSRNSHKVIALHALGATCLGTSGGNSGYRSDQIHPLIEEYL